MASKIFRNATIIAFDDATQSVKVEHDADLLIEGDTISAIGPNLKAPADAESIDATGKIISPGFINTHTHLWMTAMRTLAPNTTLAEYFGSYSQYSLTHKSFSPDDVYTSTLAGYYEGINGGVTTFVEHLHSCWSLDAFKRGYDAAVDSGSRVWWCAAVEDREGTSAAEQFAFLGEAGKRGNEMVKLGLAWDFIGGATAEAVEDMKKQIRSNNLEAITIHYLGGPWPFPPGGPSTALKHNLQALNIPMIWSHAGFISEIDRQTLREQNWFLSITPESEHHYGHGQQTSRLVQDQASLGIDTNFTFAGDLLTQARIWLQSVRNVSYNEALATGKIPRQNPMAVEEAFLLATQKGGQAVRRPDLGALKVGGKADLVVFDGDSPNMAGWTDPVAAVVLHANVGDIQDVLIGGEFKKRNFQLVLNDGSDWRSFQKKFAEIARRVQRENPKPLPLPEKFFGKVDFTDVEVMTTKR